MPRERQPNLSWDGSLRTEAELFRAARVKRRYVRYSQLVGFGVDGTVQATVKDEKRPRPSAQPVPGLRVCRRLEPSSGRWFACRRGVTPAFLTSERRILARHFSSFAGIAAQRSTGKSVHTFWPRPAIGRKVHLSESILVDSFVK